jgi:hypothetical protein
LHQRAGGDDGIMRSLLGRIPTTEETAACQESGAGQALALATPAFQWS